MLLSTKVVNKKLIIGCVGRVRTADLKTMILVCYRCTTTRFIRPYLSQTGRNKNKKKLNINI